MREKQPPLLVIWGKYESSFDASEPESYRRDVPNVWSAARLQGDSWTKYSLRKCIRPLVGDCSPGHDDDPRVPVLISRTVMIDLSREQVLRHAV